MAVKGETFDEDVLKQAPAGELHVCAGGRRLDWGGDEDKRSTSGVIVWVKAETRKWYLVQSPSRKQTTFALSTAEAELISMLGGVCEMRGVSQLRR